MAANVSEARKLRNVCVCACVSLCVYLCVLSGVVIVVGVEFQSEEGMIFLMCVFFTAAS